MKRTGTKTEKANRKDIETKMKEIQHTASTNSFNAADWVEL
jgi:hypothetical protein